MITSKEVKGLLARVQKFAEARSLTSVHAYRVCRRHLDNALRTSTALSRRAGVEHAYVHFQFLKAAAAEKASRDRKA